MYHATQKHQGIGRMPQWTKSPHNLKCDKIEADKRLAVSQDKMEPRYNWLNYQMNDGHGHMEYRDKLIEIANKIKLE
jgi:hypothetical protein